MVIRHDRVVSASVNRSWKFIKIGCLGLLCNLCLELSLPSLGLTILPVINNHQNLSDRLRGVSVRVLTENGGGSGVIIQKKDDIYTVLTCNHVLGENKKITILTDDSLSHIPERINKLPNLDLSIIQFKSSKEYPITSIANSQHITPENTIYAVGFPNYIYQNQQINSTHNWGNKSFKITTGNLTWKLTKPLTQGYQIGYTNDIEVGMSGGGIFNDQGQLIGINGRLKYPLPGIKAYQFIDGSKPSLIMFKKMESLSWGIPIHHLTTRLG